jgi:flagellar hook-associated protein 1 FlgK
VLGKTGTILAWESSSGAIRTIDAVEQDEERTMALEALSAALTGLAAAQRQIDITARNMANVQTPGYTRKIVPQETIIAGRDVLGVKTGEVERRVDLTLRRDLWRQSSVSMNLSVKETYLSRVQDFYGSVESEASIGAELNRLNAAFTKLAASPSSTVLQQETLVRGQTLARQFNTQSEVITELRNDTQTEIKQLVDDVNRLLEQISRLNKAISEEQYAQRTTAELEDQRDQAVTKLSDLIQITSFSRDDGVLVVQTVRGRPLVDSEARTLYFDPVQLGPSAAWPTSASGVRVNDPIAGPDLLNEPLGAKLGALIEMRDKTFPQMQAQLDELAHKLSMRFEAQELTLFVDGSTGIVPADTPPSPPATPVEYVGYAARIRVNPAVEANVELLRDGTAGLPVGAGSNTKIMNVLNYTFGLYQDAAGTPHVPFRQLELGPSVNIDSRLPTTAAIGDYAAKMIAFQASEHNEVSARMKFETEFQNALQTRMLDESGVDLDAEVSKLQQLQTSYAASAQMLNTVQQMFRELIEAVR